MRTLLFVFALATLAACPSAPRPILTDAHETRSSYRYTSVDKRSDAATTIETMLGREAIVARFSDHGRVAYVVRDDAATQPLFARVPFRSLDKATLVVRVMRVSDINGWGVEVNGEIHADNELRASFDAANVSEAFELLQRLELDPWQTIEETWPGALSKVASREQITLFERGFVVDLDAVLMTGNPFDVETHVPLYGTWKRSPYRFAHG